VGEIFKKFQIIDKQPKLTIKLLPILTELFYLFNGSVRLFGKCVMITDVTVVV